MKKKNIYKGVIRLIIVVIIAFWMLFEEWIWDNIVKIVERSRLLKIIKRLESFIVRQNQYLLLSSFILPFLIMIPAKLYGLYLITNGRVIKGITIFILAKVTITGLLSWLFIITKEKLLEIKTFARFYFWFNDKKEWLFSELRKLLIWQMAKEIVSQVKYYLRVKI